MLIRYHIGPDFLKNLDVIFTVRFSLNKVIFHIRAEETFGNDIGHYFVQHFLHLNLIDSFGDLLVNLFELIVYLFFNGRYDIIEKIKVKNWWDYSSISFPGISLCKDNSTVNYYFENFCEERCFLEFVGLAAYIFDKLRIWDHNCQLGKDISHDNVVFGPVLFKNVEAAVVLFKVFLNIIPHEFKRQQFNFIPQRLCLASELSHLLFWGVI